MCPENIHPTAPHRVDLDWSPDHCPNPECPSRTSRVPFVFHAKGAFDRKVDERIVRRFQCQVCRRGFSSQTFRVDYRYQRPRLHLVLFPLLVAKCSLRQAARELRCHRDTLLLRLARMGPHANRVTDGFLARHRERFGAIQGAFQLDELETFETDRRLFPVTVPVLVHAQSRFLLHAETATLPARGNLRPRDQARLEAVEKARGRRENGSRPAVTACFEKLASVLAQDARPVVWTDEKKTYPAILAEVFGDRVAHHTVHSSEPRGQRNPLFPINHTLAMLRDGMGRLVRRNWGHSKLRRNLGWHVWVWALYRNFVREWRNRTPRSSSAMELGIVGRRLEAHELFEWIDRLPRAA